MRIALVGSGGTGKTETVVKLNQVIRNLPISPEGVREYLANNNITHLREMSPRATMDMQWHILREKMEWESTQPRFISDRSTVDQLAYGLRWAGRVPEMQEELLEYEKMCLSHLGVYDRIYFMPWGRIPLVDDGIRSGYPAYQREIDYLIYGILTQNNIPFVVIKSISLNDRITEIKNDLWVRGLLYEDDCR